MRSLLLVAVIVAAGLVAPLARADSDAVDRALARIVTEDGLPGAVAVTRDGDALARHAAGYSDTETMAGFAPNTHVRAGSISKTFVAATVLQLVAEGRIDLDAPMRYTNTNYVIVGLLIEAVTGAQAADEVTRRVIAPLGLTGTYFPAADDTGLRSPFAHGYESRDGHRTDVTEFNASAAGMAGSLVSTNEDTSAFITALLDGRVVPARQLEQMMDTVEQPGQDGFRFGLGLASIDLPCGIRVWGPGGDIDGYHGYHGIMVKLIDGQPLSITVTEGVETGTPDDDPRSALLNAFYCH